MKKGRQEINKLAFYKTNPSGISLIVLVITIIVIIVLATAIIVSIVNNNPIIEANKARYESDRDNMQSIFTNTLAKIMADKKVSIGVIPGELNSVKSRVDKTVGEAAYTINDQVIGSVVFDDRENTDNDYYTGRQLPIYSKETTWHVDSEGILKLQVGDKVYGEGLIEGEELNQEIKINSTITKSSDFSEATIDLVIEYDEDITSVTINGEKVDVVKKSDGRYAVSKKVLSNGNYVVVVRAKDGSVNKEIVKVEDLTEDMEIWNRDDMELFRDKVNSGRSYKNKTVTVMEDIKLGCSETNQWNPINEFYGTFEGNNHKISELYINIRGKKSRALFSKNKGTIQNLEVEGNIKANEANTALLCGFNEGVIKNVTTSGEVGGWSATGGCVGYNAGTIELCTNKALVYPQTTSGYYGRAFGGFAGQSSGNIEKCTNYGEIRGNHGVGGILGEGIEGQINLCINRGSVIGLAADTKYNSIYIGGIAGATAYSGKHIIRNCLNIGEVKSSYSGSNVGGIAGYIAGSKSGYGIIEYCYNIGTVYGATVRGIVAKEGYSSSVRGTIELRENYFLNTCGATYGRAGSNTSAEPKAEEEMEELVKNIVY